MRLAPDEIVEVVRVVAERGRRRCPLGEGAAAECDEFRLDEGGGGERLRLGRLRPPEAVDGGGIRGLDRVAHHRVGAQPPEARREGIAGREHLEQGVRARSDAVAESREGRQLGEQRVELCVPRLRRREDACRIPRSLEWDGATR